MQGVFDWISAHAGLLSAIAYAIASDVLGESNFENKSISGLIWRTIAGQTKDKAADYNQKTSKP